MKIKHENNPSSENGVVASRQVQVPHSYFRKAKSEYADWRWAMIREFIQNSYDARATTIDFRLSVNDRDSIELSVDDDGIGMDQDTLENVLLCMGGSKKPEGSIGGFGYAKAILFFVSFFIQFVDPAYPYPALTFLALGAIVQLFSLTYLTVLILLGVRVADGFRRRRKLAASMTGGVGALFVGFGAKLASASLN